MFFSLCISKGVGDGRVCMVKMGVCQNDICPHVHRKCGVNMVVVYKDALKYLLIRDLMPIFA